MPCKGVPEYIEIFLRRGHMLNIHGYVSKCRGINIDNPSFEGSIEPFMMFKSFGVKDIAVVAMAVLRGLL